MEHFSLEVHFKGVDGSPLDMDVQEIEIVPGADEEGFIYFGIGSTFRHRGAHYRVMDLNTQYVHPVTGRFEELEQMVDGKAAHLRITYEVDSLDW